MKNILLTLSFFILTHFSFATHYCSSDISYTHISGYTYGVTIRIYNNTYNSTADRCEIQVLFGDGDSAVAPRMNGLSALCPSTHDGIMLSQYQYNKESIYYTAHTYDSTGNYIVSFTDVNRTAGICNIPNSVNTGIYAQAEIVINPLLGDNSAPQYVTVPLNYAAIGIINSYNPSVIETDGDSLYYQLIPSMVNGQSIAGFTFPPASHYFSIDSLTGTVTWDNPTMICSYSYDLKITEWRKIGGIQYYMGSTMQDVYNVVSSYTGVDEVNNVGNLSIYPNPTQSEITIEINIAETKYILVEIKNVLGQTVKTINNKELSHDNSKMEIDVRDLPCGLYFVQLQSENKVWNKNFVKD